MAVAQRLRVTCPRCATPVTGDFKYCPACAFRLKLGALEAPLAAPHGGLSAWLLGLGALALVGGLVAMGVVLFREREGPPEAARPQVSAAAMTIASLPSFMRRVEEGVADWITEEVDGELVDAPRWVRPLKVMAFEVTRRLYAEYLAALAERVRTGVSPGETLRVIWDAQDGAQRDYAQAYLMEWIDAFLRHAQGRGLSREEALEPLLQYLPEPMRAADLRSSDFAVHVLFPWPSELGLLTAGPPSWAYVNFGLVVSALPEGTEHLPVTEVAWTDANAFALWARQELGGDLQLRLPFEGEWLRIAHSNHPPGPTDDVKHIAWDWPWGNEPLQRACNNRQFWPEGFPPRLQSVDTRYLDEDLQGKVRADRTEDGIFGMAGNAREWALPDQAEPLRVLKTLYVFWEEAASRDGMAPTRGGSYLRGLYDCTVTARVSEPVGARREDVGFRLVANALP